MKLTIEETGKVKKTQYSSLGDEGIIFEIDKAGSLVIYRSNQYCTTAIAAFAAGCWNRVYYE